MTVMAAMIMWHAGPLRYAQYPLDTTRDAARYTTDSPSNDGSDRTGSASTGMSTLGCPASHALSIGRCSY